MKIRYTRRALVQLDEIYTHIAEDSPGSAGRFPYLARVTSNPAIRVMPVLPYSYLVFYTVDEKAEEVQILRIRHSAQNPTAHLR